LMARNLKFYSVIIDRSLFFIIATIFLFPFLIYLKEPGYNPYSISELTILLIMLILLVLTNKQRILLIPSSFTFTVLLYFMYQIILALGSNSYLAAYNSIVLHDKYVILSFLTFNYINDKDENFFLKAILFIGILSICLGIPKIITTNIFYLDIGGYVRLNSIFPNPNMYGVYMLLVGLLAIVLYDKIVKYQYKAIYVVLIILPTLISLVLTFSRRSWGLFIMSIIIYLLLKKGKKIMLVISMIVLILFSLLIVNYDVIVTRFMLSFDPNYASNSARSTMFSAQLYVLSENIYSLIGGLGVGLFGPTASYFLSANRLTIIDNYYLQLMLEYGFLGVIIYLSIFIITVLKGIKLLRSRALNSWEYNKVLMYIILLSTLYIAGVVGSTPITFPLNMFQWIFIGLILKNYSCHINRST